MKGARSKFVTVVAVTVEVLCPYPECGEPQPSPETGAFPWPLDELRTEILDGRTNRKCTSCDRDIILHVPSKVLT